MNTWREKEELVKREFEVPGPLGRRRIFPWNKANDGGRSVMTGNGPSAEAPRRNRWSRAGAAIVAISVIAVGGGLAWAGIPDPNGEIHACYQKENGALRVVDSATTSCRTQEVPLSWSQAGSPGPAGPQGLPGPPGPAGPEGPAGQGAKTIAGFVDVDGSVVGQGFTVIKHSEFPWGRVYDVLFPAGTWNGSTPPAMTVTPVNFTAHTAIVIPVSPGPWSPAPDGSATFKVQILNTRTTEGPTDSPFYFIAVQI